MNHDDGNSQDVSSGIFALSDSLSALRKLIRVTPCGSTAEIINAAVEALMEHQDFTACEVFIAGDAPTPHRLSNGCHGSKNMPDVLASLLVAEVFPAVLDVGYVFIERQLHQRCAEWRGCLLGVPISNPDRVIGGLVVWNGQPGSLMPWHENLLSMMADVISLALVQVAASVSNPEGRNARLPARPDRPRTRPSNNSGLDANVAGQDALSGLSDRLAFEVQLQELQVEIDRAPRARSVLHIDIDRFRLIREYGGDPTADRVIRIFADLLRHELGDECLLGCLGADEFGVVVERRKSEQALAVARSLIERTDALRLSFAGQHYDVSISVGVAEIGDGLGAGVAALRHAMQACRAAQLHGGGMVQVYTEKMVRPGRARSDGRMLNRLTHALKDDGLVLYAQLITSAASGTEGLHPQYMHELLLRLHDENGNVIGANLFLPIAERYGLSVKLDRWVIKNAFRQIAASRFSSDSDHRFTVNLSGHSIDDQRLLDFIVEQFDESGLSPTRICFEITETAAISDIAAAKAFVEALKQISCEFALDDFGSGHSSFLYLRDLPIDYLKIDGELVRDIGDDPVSLAFVRTIEGVGRLMGRRTIAEYVQSKDIYDALVEIRCDYVQGYWIGSPVPLEDVLRHPEA